MKLLKSRPLKLNTREERLVNALQALGDKSRFKIFKILLSGREMCVTEIAEALDISVPAVSQHFRIFELVGLVEKTRYGQKICYTLKKDDSLVQSLISIT
jgi:DNA-binding transcriptional ArsR family regulator